MLTQRDANVNIPHYTHATKTSQNSKCLPTHLLAMHLLLKLVKIASALVHTWYQN